MKIGKRNVSIREYENFNARIFGGLEIASGAILIGATFFPEFKEAKVPLYIGGTLLVADGAADLISGRTGDLLEKAFDLGSYISERASELVNYISEKLKSNKKYGEKIN